MEIPAFARRFRATATLTVVAVYVLILVGGIVRSTGSGMGCPDWPRCFGQWVPPTHISQLPPNYKEVYTAQRVAKNQRLTQTLRRLGFAEVAANIFAHPTQYIETDFNPTKTWIEYVNRLLGALIGVFIFATVVAAWPYRRRDPAIFWVTLLSFVTVGVQGWLGSLVVSTNLLPVMVTIHMALALVLVALLLWALVRADRGEATTEAAATPLAPGLLGALVLLTFGQIVVGTQVREEIDMIAFGLNYLHREAWVGQLSGVFTLHKVTSALLLLLNLYVALKLYQTAQPRLHRLATATLAVIGLEIAAGLLLTYAAMPAAAQPVHLTLGTLLFGGQFLLLVRYRQALKASRTAAFPAVVA